MRIAPLLLQHLDKYMITIINASIYKMIVPIDYSDVIKEGATDLSAASDSSWDEAIGSSDNGVYCFYLVAGIAGIKPAGKHINLMRRRNDERRV